MNRTRQPRVTLYSTHRCPHCRRAKQWLQQHKLPFQEFDIERNARAFKDFQRLGGRGVPVVVIDGERVDGFDPKRMQRLLS